MQRPLATQLCRTVQRTPLRATLLRGYSTESELFKGSPKFTRVEPKGKRPNRPDPIRDTRNEWGPTGRIELNSATVRRLVSTGLLVVAGVGLVGVATYYGSTYFYLRTHCPVPAEITDSNTKNLLYLATYYEQLAPNYDKAVQALEKALELIKKHGKISMDSPAVVEIKIRIAECLIKLGESDKIPELMAPVQQHLNRISNSSDDKDPIGTSTLRYRISMAIGDAYMQLEKFSEARASFGLGLVAVKDMKQQMAQQFKGEYLDSYTKLDQINLKEAVLSTRLGEAFYRDSDLAAAETLFQGTLYATKQHYAQLDMAPRVVTDMRTFVDGWMCLDAKAMLALARIEADRGSFGQAQEWIEPAREIARSQDKAKQAPCISCYSQALAQLGQIAEKQGDIVKALRRFREAHEHAQLNFAEDVDKYAAEVERLSK